MKLSNEIRLGEILSSLIIVCAVLGAYFDLRMRVWRIEEKLKPVFEWMDDIIKKGWVAAFNPSLEKSKAAKAGE